MNFMLFLYAGIVAVLLFLLAWALRRPGKRTVSGAGHSSLEENGWRHVTYLPQIRQSFSSADFAFLRAAGSSELARRVRKERRRIAFTYLPAVREDFEKILRLARVISVLSPEVGPVEEWERFRLTIQFYGRYQLIRFGLFCGVALIPQLSDLTQMVSRLAVRMEAAMTALGERAALAAELASSLDRSRMDTV